MSLNLIEVSFPTFTGMFDNSSIVSTTAGTFKRNLPPLCSIDPAVTSWLFDETILKILFGDNPYASMLVASIIISIISSLSPAISTSKTPGKLSSLSFKVRAVFTRLEYGTGP